MPCTMDYWNMVDPQKYNPFLLKPSRATCSLEYDKAIGEFASEVEEFSNRQAFSKNVKMT